MSIVQKRFLRPVTREQLQRRALALLLRDLDPYSNYLSPAELEDFLNQNADGGWGESCDSYALDRTGQVESPPDGTRRPYWMLRPLKPGRDVYKLPK